MLLWHGNSCFDVSRSCSIEENILLQFRLHMKWLSFLCSQLIEINQLPYYLPTYSKCGLRAVGAFFSQTMLLWHGNSCFDVSRSCSIDENILLQFRLHMKWLSFCVINSSKLINYRITYPHIPSVGCVL